MLRRITLFSILMLIFIALQPVQAQSGRQIWALYMGFWFGEGSWNAQSDVLIDRPALGNYDSRNGGVAGTHIDQAKGAGIDAFLVTWYGAQEGGTTAVLNTMLDQAAARGFSVGAALDVFDADFNRRRDLMVESLRYIVNDRANHPAYLRYNGKPVIFFAFQERTGFSDAVWQAIRNEVDPNRTTYWIAEGLSGCCIHGGAMDGMYAFNLAWADGSSARYSGEATATRNAGGSLYIPTIHPGWNEDAIAARDGRTNPTAARDRAGGNFLANSFAGAAASGANVMLVVSWNEFIENSHIEPSTTYGTQSLDTLRPLANQWKAGGGVSAPPPAPSNTNPANPAPAAPNQPVQGSPPSVLGEQINPGGESINVYCADGGVAIYNGDDFAIFVSGGQISSGVAAARGSGNVQIGTGPQDTGLWALTSNELQATVRGARPEYNFIFPADRCGAVDPNAQPNIPTTGSSGGTVSNPGTYTVQAGDTMFAIAARFGTTVSALAAANDISDPAQIFIGQQLIIPSGSAPVPSAPQPQAPAPTAIAPPTTRASGETCGDTYTVVAGDTILGIAAKCGSTVDAIVAANDISDPRFITIGQVLTIP